MGKYIIGAAEIATKLLQHQSIVEEHLIGSDSLSLPLKKCKLPTESHYGSRKEVCSANILRVSTTARKRPEIEVEDCQL